MFEASHREAARATSPMTPQLNEEVLRAELARLVKEYFENVEGNSTERTPPAAASLGNVASAATPRSLDPSENRPKQEMEEPPLVSYGNSRLVLEPTGPLTEERLQADKHDPVEHVPLEYYAKSEGSRRFIFVSVIILILLGAVFLGYRYRMPLRKSFNAQISTIEDKFEVEFGKGAPPPSHSEASTGDVFYRRACCSGAINHRSPEKRDANEGLGATCEAKTILCRPLDVPRCFQSAGKCWNRSRERSEAGGSRQFANAGRSFWRALCPRLPRIPKHQSQSNK